MRTIDYLLTSLLTASIAINAYAQGGIPGIGNTSTGANFLGFSSGAPQPLNIRNDFNNQIRFFTATPTSERVRIFQNALSPSCPTGGGMAINVRPFNPVGVPGSYLHIGSNIATGGGITLGSVGVVGWRNWMQLGTFMYDATDNMYVGLKNEAAPGQGDRYDAVINWGDNISSLNIFPTPGPDYMRFIFTGTYNQVGGNQTPQTTAPNRDGLEIMRMAPVGYVGIGNYYNNPMFTFKDPARRLEILSDKTVAGINGNPQFRLTHTQQNPNLQATTGLFTDFQTTNNGDLAITTFNNTNANTGTQILKERFVGINTNLPGNTIEINSQYLAFNTPNAQTAAPGFAAPTGWAGLRFTDLSSTSIPQLNPGFGVLSVDAAGDVIYVPGGNVNANNGLTFSQNNVQLGATCGSASVALGALINNREVQLNGNNFIFSELNKGPGRVGIGSMPVPCFPGNLLEISKNTAASSPISGLRLTDLANATPLPPFNNQVLSVNPTNGDVILTNVQAAGGFGGICPAPVASGLTSDWEIPLNNWSYIFGGQGGNKNNVGIGTNCSPTAKLEVLQSSGNIASTAMYVESTDPAGGFLNPVVGIKSFMNNPLSCIKIAGWFDAGASSPTCNNFGLFVPQNGGNVAIGYSVPNLNLAGSLLNVNGNINAAGTIYPSDQSLKNTINNINNTALQKIKSLRPVTYYWNTALDSGMAGMHAGFIAQEVDTVIPHIVKTSSTGLKSLAYTEIIPYLVKAMQEQQRHIEVQDSLIQVLTQNIQSCCSNTSVRSTGVSGNNINQLNIELSDKDVIVLNQNVPNPFAEQTTITYNVPDQYGFAQIIFKTNDGKIIKAVDITKKGKGLLNVFANDLSHGLYMYTLIVDGKVIDTKKMVKE
jgi:hypothetical protein